MKWRGFRRPAAENAGVREQAEVRSKLCLSNWRVSHSAMIRAATRHRRSMQTFCFTLWILNALILSHGSDFRPDERKGVQFPEAQGSSRQRWLEGVSTVEELLELLYPGYALAQRCLQRMAQGTPAFPLQNEDTGRFPREAPEPQAEEAIKAIIEEIQLTACQPREVCVEVAKEYTETTSHFFVPRCVSVHRCGGCCYDEGQDCTNTSYTLVEKTVLELVPMQVDKSVIKTMFVNHTSCECQSKSPFHTISRRATANSLLSQCSPPDVPCSLGLVWNPTECKCMHKDFSPPSVREMAPLLAHCGPKRILNRQCECECRNGLTQASCGSDRTLDEESCQCICREPPPTEPCPPNQRWNRETCSCVCQANCTLGYSPSPEKCLCQCRKSPRICHLKGMTFRPENCSCQQWQKKPTTSHHDDGKRKFSRSSLAKQKFTGPV